MEGDIIYILEPQDNLYLLAQRFYGNGNLWPLIYNRNKENIGENPEHIEAGMIIVIPTVPY